MATKEAGADNGKKKIEKKNKEKLYF